MHVSHTLRLLGAGLLLASILAYSAVGARAEQDARPGAAPVGELRSLADHYRSVTWDYQRAARQKRSSTSFRYRHVADRDYLRWAIDVWTRRAYVARNRALVVLHHRLDVELPRAPALRAPLAKRIAYSRRLTLRLRRLYPGRVTRSFASASAPSGRATLRLWQQRSAVAMLAVALHGAKVAPHHTLPSWLETAFLCIHRYEGAWTSNTGNGYYGGLQMNVGFMRHYAPEFVHRWGTADRWPVWAQLETARRAHISGLGFSPWPNTARACGLI
jgi:hypothetical protein